MSESYPGAVAFGRRPSGPRWLLFDYGEVISLSQPAEDVLAMAGRAQLDSADFAERYWRHRPAYDRGQPSRHYWGDVLGRALRIGDPVIADLDLIDVGSWSHLDLEMVRLLGELARDGHRLALLSNAPEPLARSIDDSRWARVLTHRFYSCRLALIKPAAAAFEAVLDRLGAAPTEMTFIDDRLENRRAAAELGIDAIAYPGSSACPVSELRAALAERVVRPGPDRAVSERP